MQCKKCGAENERPFLEAVYPTQLATVSDPAAPSEVYARWACFKCGRYHFRNGTLYSNPYKT